MGIKVAAALLLFWIAVAAGSIIGWAMNIYTLVHTTAPWSGLMVARVAGIFFFPLGVILGYI